MNKLGATYWTDGYVEGPMYVEQSWLRKASETQELFWFDECEEVSRRPMGTKAPEDSKNIAISEEPTADDFRKALNSGVADTPKKERFIRLRLWWAANDPVRTGKQPAPNDPDWAENLEAFIALLDQENDDERLVLAEIAREVGDFSAAWQLLDDRDDEYSQFLRALIQKNDTTVRKIVLPAEGATG